MSNHKSAPRLQRFDEIAFAPRFAYGDMADVAGVCGADDGTELGVGWGRMHDAQIPWTIRYDEVLTVFEGLLRVHVGKEVFELQARDSLWLPEGTELVYEAEYALVHFAIHPSDWQLPE